MKALSIRQPWAWAILHAGKRIENRSRADGRMPSLCSYRGPLLLHAAKTINNSEYRDAIEWMVNKGLLRQVGNGFEYPHPSQADIGGIVGVCNVVAHIRPDGYIIRNNPAHLPDVNRAWHIPGSYGLVLADVRPLPFTPYKGALGFFDVPGATPDDVVAIARRERRVS